MIRIGQKRHGIRVGLFPRSSSGDAIIFSIGVLAAFIAVPASAGLGQVEDTFCEGVHVNSGPHTIQDAVASNPPGTTFCLAAGIYRLDSAVYPKDNQQFIGDGPGTAISGATRLMAWTQNGDNWYTSINLNDAAFDCLTVSGECTGFRFKSNVSTEFSRSRGDLFRNGVRVERVGERYIENSQVKTVGNTDPSAGEYFIDYVADRIYIGEDPALANSWMAANQPIAFCGKVLCGAAALVKGVVIKNLKVLRFANSNGSPGEIVIWTGRDWVIDSIEAGLNHARAVGLHNGSTLRNSTVFNNGMTGVGPAGGRPVGVLVEGNELVRNNEEIRTVQGQGDSGIKLGGASRSIIRNNNVHDNVGNGIWLDCGARMILIEGNHVERNSQHGIIQEIGYETIIRGNTVIGNGKVRPNAPGGWNANIMISTSGSSDPGEPLDPWWTNVIGGTRSIEIYGNTMDTSGPLGNANSIALIQQPRDAEGRVCGPDHGPHLTQDVSVHNNTVIISGQEGARTGAWQHGTEGNIHNANNAFEDNEYYHECNGANLWWYWDGDRNWAGWTFFGHDTPDGNRQCI